MPERFPRIEPYDAGMLDVGDGQRRTEHMMAALNRFART
jgi:hypothetical protein